MKISKFVTETEIDGGLLLYNSLTTGILALNKEYKQAFEIAKRNLGDCPKKDLVNELIKGEMFVKDELNEAENVKFLNNKVRFNSDTFVYTIAPTLKCNFACPYCYEEGVRYNTMTKEVVDETIEFIKSNMNQQTKKTSICWYGGEPLLKIDIIEKISQELIEENESSSNYNAVIVTNGYYLTRENAKRLKENKIGNAQVTLDGPPSVHDTRRKLLNGKPTFNKIIDNIKESWDIIDIVIRINVDKSNIQGAMELLDILEQENLKNRVGVYIAAVDDVNDMKPNPDCFSDKEFSVEELNFYEYAIQRGYDIVRVPQTVFGVCGAIVEKSFVIDPLGNLYKCWNEIGRIEKNVGSVSEGSLMNSVHTQYLNYEAIDEDKCYSCKVLPSCMGGCPHIKLELGTARCSAIKFNAQEISKMLFELKNREVE